MPTVEYSEDNRPFRGEEVSGDATAVLEVPGGLLLALIDALGHGPPAHEVAVQALAFLREHASPDVAGLMQRLHAHLRGGRGAAVGLAFLELDTGRVQYTGTGNTAIRRVGGRDGSLVSQPGVVGQNMPTPLVRELTLEPGEVLLLHSDGIPSRFPADDHGWLWVGVPGAARWVVDSFGKEHDDAACIVLRYQR